MTSPNPTDADFKAALLRLAALDPGYMTPLYQEIRLKGWSFQGDTVRGRKMLMDKVTNEIRVREARKERE